MIVNKALIFLATFYIFCSPVFSQPARSSIYFKELQHNFGLVKEEDGPLQHDFVFTNKGEDSLIITSIRAGSGLSVEKWTRSPVMPGDSGIITVKFDPVYMHGRFNRSITVNATGNPSSLLLRLLGEVIPGEKTVEELYTGEIGHLRLRSGHISFGQVSPGSVKTDSLEVINISGEELVLSFSDVPAHIALEAVPSRLKSGAKGDIVAVYDAGKVDDWGVITHHFRLLLNGASPGRNILYISANIQEDFSEMSDEEKAKAPSISFENRVFDFGTLGHGDIIEHEFIFFNTGKSDLIIRRVRSGCGCTAIEPVKTQIKPGEKGSIKAVFNSQGFQGKQNKGITVISNDPSSPNIVLRLTGEVKSE